MTATTCRRARALAAVVRSELREAGFTVLRTNQDSAPDEVAVYVVANDVLDGRVDVLVIGSARERQERHRAREVLRGRHKVGYDSLGMTLMVQA